MLTLGCLSALKYATTFPVIFLSALKYHVAPEMWTNFYRPLWLLSSVINSCYSFYWDITRDWELRFAYISTFCDSTVVMSLDCCCDLWLFVLAACFPDYLGLKALICIQLCYMAVVG